MMRAGMAVMRRQVRHLVNIASFVLTRLLAIGAFAASVPLFIRSASAAEYGVVAVGFSLLGLSLVLDVALGYVTTQSVGRRLARTGAIHPALVSKVMAAYLLLSLVMALALWCSIWAWLGMSAAQKSLYLWLPLLLPCLSVSGVAGAVLQAHHELAYLNLSRFSFELGKAIAIAVSGWAFGSVAAIGPILLAVVVLRAAGDVFVLRKRLGYALGRPSLRGLRRTFPLLRLGLPALGIVLLTLSVSIGDKLLVAAWFSPEAVAWYSAAFDINTKAYLLASAVNATMLSVIVRNHALRRGVDRQIAPGVAVALLLALIYYIPVMFYAKDILSIWISPEFAAGSAGLARIMAAASIVYLIGNPFEVALLGMGGAKYVLLVYLAGVAGYFASVPFTVHAAGLAGFMWSYLLLSVVLAAGWVIVYRRKRRDHRPISPSTPTPA
ncbi:MAG: lipopolysaccharide biosynthesis protein [Ramlibacter sp.]